MKGLVLISLVTATLVSALAGAAFANHDEILCAGDDSLRTADDAPGDVLDCGDGVDRYTADPGDTVTNCETDVTG